MSSTTLPRQRGINGRWLAAGIAVVVVVILAALFINNAPRSATTVTSQTVAVSRGNIIATVAGSGSVVAEQSIDLAFQTTGPVTKILVSEGAAVSAGQPLAQVDERLLQIQVANAEASLRAAQARLTQAQEGNARPEDLAAANAQLASVQANYNKLAAGPSAAELGAAQAGVRSAQAAYDAAVNQAGAGDSQLQASFAALKKAEAALQQAQANYDQVSSRADIGRLPQSVALQNATIDYQQAKSNYDALAATSGSDGASRVQSASAQLAQARSTLAKLSPTKDDLAASQASVDQAQANLEKLTAPATATDLAIQQANVDQAEQALKQAQLNLANATLVAPFDGVVTAVNVVPGSFASTATPALRLVQTNNLHVDLKLSENDVVKVQQGQPVVLTIDSMPDWQANGQVTYLSPAADATNGVVTYAVRVGFTNSDPRVKVGMTANIDIKAAEKDGVLLVPNTALLPNGTGRVVQVPTSDGKGTTEVAVETGLSDGTNTEIISGLNEGQRVIALPSLAGGTSRRGPFGN